ncbi:MAG: hypothetical protein RLO01_01835 [Thalassobaculaceae bacterium]
MSGIFGGAPSVEMGDVIRAAPVSASLYITPAENTNGFIITWLAYAVESGFGITLTPGGQRLVEGSPTTGRFATGGHGYGYIPPGVGVEVNGNNAWIVGRFL